MAAADILFEFEENCSTDETEEYFRNLECEIKEIPICTIPYSIIKTIVLIINSTKLYASDWKEYAADMGLDDNLTLANIEGTAEAQKELPLYIALNGPLQHNGKFGKLVKVLLRKGRLDVLTKIKPLVQDFLERIKLKKKQRFPGDCSSSELLTSYPNTSDLNNLNYIPMKCKDAMQQKALPSRLDNQVTLVSNCLLKKKNYLMSVFIPHTAEDIEPSEKLAALLRNEFDIDARLLSDLEAFIAVDDCGVLNSILNQVDFIVPVISSTYLEYIHPSEILEAESEDVTNNRYIFRWIQSEFKKNSSLNLRVRPVMVNKLDIRLVRRELIFSYPFRLWTDVPKLVKIMFESKRALKSLINKNAYVT